MSHIYFLIYIHERQETRPQTCECEMFFRVIRDFSRAIDRLNVRLHKYKKERECWNERVQARLIDDTVNDTVSTYSIIQPFKGDCLLLIQSVLFKALKNQLP